MNWSEEFNRREEALDPSQRVVVEKLYTQLRPKLLRLFRKERDALFVRLLRDKEVIEWTVFVFIGMSLSVAEQTRWMRERGWNSWKQNTKGGKATAALFADSPKRTREKFNKVMRDCPTMPKRAAVLRVAELLECSESTVWKHLKKTAVKR